MGAENFLLIEANMEFVRIFVPIQALGCVFASFGLNMDAGSFADVACRELSIPYEEYGYRFQRDFT